MPSSAVIKYPWTMDDVAYVRRVIIYTVGNAPDVDDLTQETFLRACKSLPGFRGASKLKTWLHRIAVNVVNDWLRSRARNKWVYWEDLNDRDRLVLTRRYMEATPYQYVWADDMLSLVEQTLESLAPHYSAALHMRAVRDMPYRAIALRMDWRESTARVVVFQAKEAIRAAIERGSI